MNLELLSRHDYPPAVLLPLSDFSLVSLLSHSNYSTIFSGKHSGAECVLETCDRIPYRIVCSEIALLNELSDVADIVRVIGATKNDSLGVVSIAYSPFCAKRSMQSVSAEGNAPIALLVELLSILKHLHRRNVFHGWVCDASVMIKEEGDGVVLAGFHSAGKVGDKRPFCLRYPGMPEQLCQEDPRKDDVYAAAVWFLSFYTKPENALSELKELPIEKKMKKIIRLMTSQDIEKRISASVAIKCIKKVVPSISNL